MVAGTVIHGQVELSDGRRVVYCEAGDHDAPVVLYCHGTPGSRLELLLARPTLERLDVPARIIALNRPGYGTSSFHDLGGFLTWARDVGEAMDRLGIDRFAVLGASGGSPFALACALALGERVRRVGIAAGVAPPDTPGMEHSATLAGESQRRLVRSLRYGSLSLAARVGLTDMLVSRIVARLGPEDRRALERPEASISFAEIVDEAFAQWGRAAVVEAGLFMQPWDFDPRLVSHEVRLWHGKADTRIPVSVAEAFADRLANADCVLWPDHGHFSWALSDDLAAVVAFLAQRPDGSEFPS